MTTLEELVADPWFPFEGEVRVKQLLPRQVPEPDRTGLTPKTCSACAASDAAYIWTDEHWRLRGMGEPSPVPGIVLLEPREHHDSYVDLPPERLAELGPLTARIERALLSLGDGGAHLHQWFFPRPLGQLQLRGSMLPVWLDVLPAVDPEVEAATLRRIAAAMAAST